MFTEYLIAAVWGVLITVFIEIIGVLVWFHALQDTPPNTGRTTAIKRPHNQVISQDWRQQPSPSSDQSNPSPSSDQSNRPNDSPQHSGGENTGEESGRGQPSSESCDWMNIIVNFVFRELRDTPRLKKLMMKQINKEFTELLLTKSQGKMLERLSVREYDMGSGLPSFSNILLIKEEKDKDGVDIEVIEFEVDVDYDGGFELSIDADLVFKKVAFVSLRVNKVKGRGRMQFSKSPFTHWSFSFLSSPQLDISVNSQFEGRELSQLSAFLKLQFIRWVKRVHTMPNYKTRFKPFFIKIKPQDQLMDVYLHNSSITRGELLVRVFDCYRLVLPETAVELYCTVSIGDMPTDLQIGMWQKMWPCEEITIERCSSVEQFGLKYESFPISDEGKKTLIVVTRVIPHSPSYKSGLREGDILKKVDNYNLTNINQTDKLIKNTKALRLLLSVRRPTIDVLKVLQEKAAEVEHSSRKKVNKHARSKSPVKGKNSTPVPIPALIPDPTELEEPYTSTDDIDDYHGDDIGGGGRGQYDRDQWVDVPSLENSSASNVRKRSTNNRERSLSTPPLFETNAHRVLGSSLEPPPEVTTTGTDHTPSPPTAAPDVVSDDVSGKDYGIGQSLDSCTTRSVSVSRNPVWDEEMKLLITSESRYLNVCVWCRLQGSDQKNFMIGNVTISLTDLALECAASGLHKQRYVLLPSKDMQISRMGLKAMTEAMKDLPPNAKVGVASDVPKYVGEIYLSFIHEPMEAPPDTANDDVSMVEQNESFNTNRAEPSFKNHPFVQAEGTEPDKHDFQSHEFNNTYYKDNKSELVCDGCQKKLKKKCMKCGRCGRLVHEKCVKYCTRMLPCKSEDDYKDQSTDWEQIDSQEVQINSYSVTKQMFKEPEQTLTEEEMLFSEKDLHNDRISLEEPHVTPPVSSESEDDLDHQPSHNTTQEEIDGSDFIDIYTRKELEDKIIEAQKQLEMLEANKRLLTDEKNSMDQENYQYKLQKLEAQKETTLIKLNEYKEKLRQIPPL